MSLEKTKAKYFSTFEKIIFPFIIGVILPHYFNFNFVLLFCVLVFTTLCSLISFILLKNKFIKNGFLLLSFFVLGLCIADEHLTGNKDKHFSKTNPVFLVGTVAEYPKNYTDSQRVLLEVNHAIISNNDVVNSVGYLMLTIQQIEQSLSYGDKIMLPAKFNKIKESFLPSTFNYSRYMRFKDIHHQAYIKGSKIVLLGKNQRNILFHWALIFREKFKQKFIHLFGKNYYSDILSGIILGDRNELEQEVIDLFTFSGTVHILSISGAHVALIATLIIFLLGLIQRRLKLGGKNMLPAIFFVSIYVFITGLTTPACRAGVMISIYLLGLSYGRRNSAYNVIFIAAFLQIIFNPNIIFTIGFQLSYLAVFGLILVYPSLKNIYYPSQKLCRYFMDLIYISTSAQLATSILSVFYFKKFPLYFLLANVLMVIPLFIIMYLGVFILIFPYGFFTPIYGIDLVKLSIDFLIESLVYITRLPYAYDIRFHFNIWDVFIGTSVMFILFRFRLKKFIIVLLLFAFSFSLAVSNYLNHLNVSSQKELIIYPSSKTQFVFLVGVQSAYVVAYDFENKYIVKKIEQLKNYYQINDIQFVNFDKIQWINFPKKLPYIKTKDIALIISKSAQNIENISIFYDENSEKEEYKVFMY